MNYDSLVSKSILWKNKSIGYVNKKWNFSSDLDFAIIDKDFPMNKLESLINSKTIIILPNITYYPKNKINTQSLSKTPSFIHDLRKSGAYIYHF